MHLGPELEAEKAEKRAIALCNRPLWMALMNVQRSRFWVNRFFVDLPRESEADFLSLPMI
jgi:hypothetical protein